MPRRLTQTHFKNSDRMNAMQVYFVGCYKSAQVDFVVGDKLNPCAVHTLQNTIHLDSNLKVSREGFRRKS